MVITHEGVRQRLTEVVWTDHEIQRPSIYTGIFRGKAGLKWPKHSSISPFQ